MTHTRGEDAAPLIHATGLARHFEPATVALRSANLRVYPGESVALTGPSGAGKSTLLSLLGLLDSPSAGSYEFCGREVSRAGAREQARLRMETIGFVFQAFHLVPHLSVLQNVELAPRARGWGRAQSRRLADDVLSRVGLSHRTHARPGTLSGGEAQRVAIARALCVQPAVLLCDEPTGNLDSSSSRAILDLILAAVGPRSAVLIVTHEAEVAASCDRVIRVSDGVTAEIGAQDVRD